MEFNRWDIIQAHHAYYADHHSGQWSDEYARLCRCGRLFRPGPLWLGYDSLTENGQEIYNELVERNTK